MVTLCSSDLSPLSGEVVSPIETVSDDVGTDWDSSSRMTRSAHVWRQTAVAACTNQTVPVDEEVSVSDCMTEPVDELPSAAGYTTPTAPCDEDSVTGCTMEPVGVAPSEASVICCTKQRVDDHSSAVACTTPIVPFEAASVSDYMKRHVDDLPSVATGCMKRHDGTALVLATEMGYSSVHESIYSPTETACTISRD